jgi:hypothetical protein
MDPRRFIRVPCSHEQNQEVARVAVLTSWATPPDRAARTQSARDAAGRSTSSGPGSSPPSVRTTPRSRTGPSVCARPTCTGWPSRPRRPALPGRRRRDPRQRTRPGLGTPGPRPPPRPAQPPAGITVPQGSDGDGSRRGVMAVEAYGASPTRRSRRTKSDMDLVRAHLFDIVAQGWPMTVRQVFYQAVTRGIELKTEGEYKSTVCRLLTEMRLEGDLPYSFRDADLAPRRSVLTVRRAGAARSGHSGAVSATALATIYRRSGSFFITSSDRTTEGVWVQSGSAERVDGDDPEAIGSALLRQLDRSTVDVRHPRQGRVDSPAAEEPRPDHRLSQAQVVEVIHSRRCGRERGTRWRHHPRRAASEGRSAHRRVPRGARPRTEAAEPYRKRAWSGDPHGGGRQPHLGRPPIAADLAPRRSVLRVGRATGARFGQSVRHPSSPIRRLG